MEEKCRKLFEAARALVQYINEEEVYDKLGDAGCGGVDPYRSDRFMALIKTANEALKTVETESKD